MIDYDVIVVGAGPGGSMAAKTCAERGLDVLLIEKRQEIGVPVILAENPLNCVVLGTGRYLEEINRMRR